VTRTIFVWLLAAITTLVPGLTPTSLHAAPRAKVVSATRISPRASGRTDPTPPSAPPASVVATVESGRIVLTWSAVDGATGYKVFRSTDNTWAAPPMATTRQPGFRDRKVTVGTYFYKVAGYNRGGTGPLSDAVSATIVAPPGAPTGVVATAGNASVATQAQGAVQLELLYTNLRGPHAHAAPGVGSSVTAHGCVFVGVCTSLVGWNEAA